VIALAKAEKFAWAIVKALDGLCQRVEIAGSIRRRRPQVNDIDLVVLADRPDLVKDRFKKTCTTRTDGEEIASFIHASGIQIDVFFARPAYSDLFFTIPSNFGSVLVCRTGSKEHNIYLVEHAKKMGLIWRTNAGVFDQEEHLLASDSEESIFVALQLPCIPPEKREYLLKTTAISPISAAKCSTSSSQ
jgi:DNA polymerase (family 10)